MQANGYQIIRPSEDIPNEVYTEPIFGSKRNPNLNLDQDLEPCILDPRHLDMEPNPYLFWLEDLDLRRLNSHIKISINFKDLISLSHVPLTV